MLMQMGASGADNIPLDDPGDTVPGDKDVRHDKNGAGDNNPDGPRDDHAEKTNLREQFLFDGESLCKRAMVQTASPF